MRTSLLALLVLFPALRGSVAPAAAQDREERREEREARERRQKEAKRAREAETKRKRDAEAKRKRDLQQRQKAPAGKPAPHPGPRPASPSKAAPPAAMPAAKSAAPAVTMTTKPAVAVVPRPAPRAPSPAAAARPVSAYLPPARPTAPLPAPAPLTKPTQFVRAWSPPPAPATLPGGAPAAGAASAPPPAAHPATSPVMNTAVVIQEQQETVTNRYYWHNDGGVTYVHYVQDGGTHWWGFYVGNQYYWSQRQHGRWWWHDPFYDRIVYYHGGYWWWQDPSRPDGLYVYMNGGYVPYQAAVAAQSPAPVPAVSPAPSAAPAVARTTNVVVGVAPAGGAAPVPPAAPVYSSDVDSPHYSMKADPARLALVIGVEDYAALPKAEFASRDALTVAEHLRHLGYADRNLAVIVDSQAARGSVAKFVEGWLPDHVTADTRVFVYFSGHGAPDPKTGDTYLMPWDGDAKYLAATGYRLKTLYEKLNDLPAKEVIVVLDACFSGAGGRSVLPEGARPLVTKADLGRAVAGRAVVFAASAGDEITGAAPKQGHGLFTYYFLKGLNGEAREGTSGVTVQDLYDYLLPQVEDAARRDGRDQTPQLLVPPDGGRGLLVKDLR